MKDILVKKESIMNTERKISWPQYDTEQYLKAIKKVLETNRWALSGYWTGESSAEQKFAKEFAHYCAVPYAVPTTSGTSALSIALESLNIGYGDEVIVPALTWLAPVTAILGVNATPILADVDPDTYCLDPSRLESLISEKTRAIIAIHLYGNMANMDEISRIAKDNHLFVIEDCAQSHGAQWLGRKAGTIGDVGTFSFQQGKAITSGEGGIAITSREDTYNKLQQLRSDSRTCARTTNKYGAMELVAKGEIQGSNYCMSEFQAALLQEQLEKLDEQIIQKETNACCLKRLLEHVDGVKCLTKYQQNNIQSYYGFVIKFTQEIDVNNICERLCEKLGVGDFFVHPVYPAVHKNVLFCPWTKKRYPKAIARTEQFWRNINLPVAEHACDEAIVLHHSLLLQDHDVLVKIANEIMACIDENGKK